MNTATDRALLLLEEIPLKDLAEVNSSEYRRWQNVKRGRVRFGLAEAEALGEKFPQYAYWILTGKTDPESGHISPEILNAVSSYNKTGTDTD